MYFAVYTFTRDDIKDALLGAKFRGLIVQGIVDKDQTASLVSQTKLVKTLRDAGIPVAVQSHSGIMHLKAVVTDHGYISGSYNWTAAATKVNDEVIEVGRDDINPARLPNSVRRTIFQIRTINMIYCYI